VVTPPHTKPPDSSLLSVAFADSARNQLLKRFRRAIQHKTISRSIPATPELPLTPRVDAGAFGAFHEFLRVSFPATHQNITLQKVNNFSLLFKWSGSRPDLPAAIMLASGAKENVLPASASAVINYRLLPGDSVQGIVSNIRQVVDDKRVNIAPLPSANPATSVSATDTAGYKAIESTVRAVFASEDVIVAPYLTVGATDARHFAEVAENQYRLLPILFDAADLQRIHGLNERIRVDEYLRMIQFYTGLLVELTNHQADL